MSGQRIAILGFGFSGLMVVSQLVRRAPAQTICYIVADDLNALGVAYSTHNIQHLLNVPANKMGAFPDVVDGFSCWLETQDAALARQRLGISAEYAPTDFVPRALYGAYLQSIWEETQRQAVARGIFLKLVESCATGIASRNGLAVLTERGDAIAVDHVVLATGNAPKTILPELPASVVIQDPWSSHAFANAHEWASPVMLMGMGLSGVDVVLSLRSAGYTGEVIAFSRHGLVPQAHAPVSSIFAFDKQALLAQPSLAGLVRLVRQALAEHLEWRPVVDALRPYTALLWQRLTLREQQRFLRRMLSIWNVYRHRMAPDIAATIREEIMRTTLRVVASPAYTVRMEEAQPVVTLHIGAKEEVVRPSRIVNCTGLQMAVAQFSSPLFKQALADGLIEPHATGLGIAVDPHLRAWGAAYPHLYAIGTLATGQLLESTAVPELRQQALQVAMALFPEAAA